MGPNERILAPSTLPPLIPVILLSFVMPALYLALSWYLAQVVPKAGGGVRQNLFFFLRKSYWFPVALELQETKTTLVCQDLVKQYGDKMAVAGFTFTFNEGKVYSLLGQNGAGKTTLINMLSGLEMATSGTATFAGHLDLRTDLVEIRKLISICPQHDLLFKNLTPLNHIELYVSIQNTDLSGYSSVKEFALTLLAKVELEGQIDDIVSTFSGGMQRRLSLILASIGNSPIIFLDEPTTGLDPVSKRLAWKVIEEMKENSIVLLTTHSMEEAEALGDEVIIMAEGVVKAEGTPLSLINQFGAGYQLALIQKSESKFLPLTVEKIESWISLSIPDSQVLSCDAGNVVVGLEIGSLASLTPFLRMVEKDGIFSWRVRKSSLEEVFVRLNTNNLPATPNSLNSSKASPTVFSLLDSLKEEAPAASVTKTFNLNAQADDAIPKTTSFHQIAAIFKRNLTTLSKEWIANIAYVILTAGIVFLITIAAREEKITGCDGKATYGGNSRFYGQSCNVKSLTGMPNCTSLSVENCFDDVFELESSPNTFSMRDAYFGFADINPSFFDSNIMQSYVPYNPNSTIPPHATIWATGLERLFTKSTLPPSIVSVSDIVSSMASAQASIVSKRTPLDISCKQDEYYEYKQNRPPATVGYQTTNVEEFVTAVHHTYPDIAVSVEASSSNSLNYRFYYYPSVQGGDPYVNLYLLNASSLSSELEIFAPSNYSSNPNNISCMGLAPVEYGILSAWNHSAFSLVSSMTNAFLLSNGRNGSIKASFNNEFPFVTRIGHIADSVITISCMFLIFASMFSLPRLVYHFCYERSRYLFEFQRIQGVKPSSFYASTLLYFLMQSLAASVIVIIVALILKIHVFDNMIYMVVTIIASSYSTATMAFFVSAFFKDTRHASIFSYIFLILCVALPAIVYTPDGIPTGLAAFALFPPVGFAFCLIDAIFYSSSKWIVSFSFWMIGSTIFFFLSVIIHELRKSPHLQTYGMFASLLTPKVVAQNNADEKDKSEVVQIGKKEDEDVSTERERVYSLESTKQKVQTNDLRLLNLGKTFGRKEAVKGITLGVPFGEVFGLLGPNGAGKSSTLSMLAGASSPTTGYITINGQDSHENGVSQMVGLCPQFDTVWEDLTVQDHLRFYSRVRGVPKADLEGFIQELANSVELGGEHFIKPAKSLSGGMLRRLSIACALTASPKVLILDEPSSGLDPISRRGIWSLLDKIRSKDRAIIITTHSMEEADSLCQRIGLVCNGRLTAIGTPNHLKSKFGAGLQKEIGLNQDILLRNLQESLSSKLASSCRIISHSLESLSTNQDQEEVSSFKLTVSMDSFDAVQAFSRIQAFCKGEAFISEWAFNQSGLEEAFCIIVANNK